MRKTVTVAVALLCCVLGGAVSARAGDRFILRASGDAVDDICRAYQLQRIRDLGRPHLFLVAGPDGASAAALQAEVAADPRVQHFEGEALAAAASVHLDQSTSAFLDQSTSAFLDQSTSAFLDALDRSPTDFFGATAWAGYVDQAATDLIGVPQVRADSETGGGTVVAVIDTGVDPDQPILKASLVPGFDFTRDLAGAGSEWTDLDQSTSAFLDQSTSAFLDASSLPAAFGHGTMVSGLIHLVAPEAKIMPLKAFRADGSGDTSDILRAIYYAVERGAKVINMSFSSDSAEVKRAIQYATSMGVICVGSAGNDGKETLVYPAAFKRVLGVASTALDDTIAPFSNYGEELVKVAAPGENLITTYPGARYALVSGTSFSSGLVSGAAAVLAGVRPDLDHRSIMDILESSSRYLSEDLGYGRIDVAEAARGLGGSE